MTVADLPIVTPGLEPHGHVVSTAERFDLAAQIVAPPLCKASWSSFSPSLDREVFRTVPPYVLIASAALSGATDMVSASLLVPGIRGVGPVGRWFGGAALLVELGRWLPSARGLAIAG